MQILEQQPQPVKRQQPLKAILKPAPGSNSSLPTSPSNSVDNMALPLSQNSPGWLCLPINILCGQVILWQHLVYSKLLLFDVFNMMI